MGAAERAKNLSVTQNSGASSPMHMRSVMFGLCSRARYLFVFQVALVISGGIFVTGCGSSAPAEDPTPVVGGSGTGTNSDDGGEQIVYAKGQVIYPDTTVVPGAFVEVRPRISTVSTATADSQGVFEFYNPFSEAKYTFRASVPGRDVSGETTVTVPNSDRIGENIFITIGVEQSLDAISLDSIRASPEGPGLKRTGNR